MTTPDEARSRTMRAVRSKDTKPEMVVRKLLHSMGYRFRLHKRDLPGSPDLVFAGRRCVIFVHGCFWHGHDCRRGARRPKTNAEYWLTKIDRNRERDARVEQQLAEDRWRALIVWECELRGGDSLANRLRAFLDGN